MKKNLLTIVIRTTVLLVMAVVADVTLLAQQVSSSTETYEMYRVRGCTSFSSAPTITVIDYKVGDPATDVSDGQAMIIGMHTPGELFSTGTTFYAFSAISIDYSTLVFDGNSTITIHATFYEEVSSSDESTFDFVTKKVTIDLSKAIKDMQEFGSSSSSDDATTEELSENDQDDTGTENEYEELGGMNYVSTTIEVSIEDLPK